MNKKKCCEKDCEYKELNGGDDKSDFYFCKFVGVSTDRGEEECFIDKWDREDVK